MQAAPYDENLINYFFKTFEEYNIVIKIVYDSKIGSIGIIKESRNDESRAPIAPEQIKELKN